MADKIVADLGRVTGDNIDHAGRKHLGNFLQCHTWRQDSQFGRLHHHSIAGHQRLRQFRAKDRQWPVPGHDQRRHAAWLAGDDGIEWRPMLDLVAGQPLGIGGCGAESVAKARHFEMGLLYGLAMFAAEQPCLLIDIVTAGFKKIRNLIQLRRAFGIACPRPGQIGGMRGPRRRIDIPNG